MIQSAFFIYSIDFITYEVFFYFHFSRVASVYLWFCAFSDLAVCCAFAEKRKAVYAATFLFGNGLMIAALMFRIHLMFRLSAAWMVLLLFALFTSLIVLFLEHVCRLIFRQPEKRERALRLLAPVILCGFFALAVYNAYTPIVRHAEITIDKPMAKPVRIGMAADTHLGVLVGARQLDKLADIMQQEKVDVILLPGDIMDDDTVAYLAENMQPHLQKLRAPLGVYATLGNHDYRETNSITQAIQAAGITVLDDGSGVGGR